MPEIPHTDPYDSFSRRLETELADAPHGAGGGEFDSLMGRLDDALRDSLRRCGGLHAGQAAGANAPRQDTIPADEPVRRRWLGALRLPRA